MVHIFCGGEGGNFHFFLTGDTLTTHNIAIKEIVSTVTVTVTEYRQNRIFSREKRIAIIHGVTKIRKQQQQQQNPFNTWNKKSISHMKKQCRT